MSDFTEARKAMVDCQIRPSDVTQRNLLDALHSIPRERFVPRSQIAKAHADVEVNLGEGRSMLRPRELAKLVQAGDISPQDVVLDIGCGRGYSTALLAALCETVIGLEDPKLGQTDKASDLLADISANNAVIIEGDLKKGAPGQGPFDVILVNGAVSEVPQAWFDQLADKGRLMVFVREGEIGRATIYTKTHDKIGERVVFDAAPAIIPGFEAVPSFVF